MTSSETVTSFLRAALPQYFRIGVSSVLLEQCQVGAGAAAALALGPA